MKTAKTIAPALSHRGDRTQPPFTASDQAGRPWLLVDLNELELVSTLAATPGSEEQKKRHILNNHKIPISHYIDNTG